LCVYGFDLLFAVGDIDEVVDKLYAQTHFVKNQNQTVTQVDKEFSIENYRGSENKVVVGQLKVGTESISSPPVDADNENMMMDRAKGQQEAGDVIASDSYQDTVAAKFTKIIYSLRFSNRYF